MDWESHSIMIYFYPHPILGKQDYEWTARVFRISSRTLEGWITKSEMKKRWISMVNELNFDDVVSAIPESSVRQKTQRTMIDPALKLLNPVETSKCFKIFTRSSDCSKTHQATLAMANATNALYVKRGCKRIGNKLQLQTRKYVEVQEFISETITHRWNMGMLIAKEELR